MLNWPAKDPDELLDYTWQPDLDAGDTIAAFTATVAGGTVTIINDAFTDTLATLWLSGGEDGETATFTLRVTTTGGRTFEETAVLAIVATSSNAAALIAAFPRFASVAGSTIDFWMTRAARSVDDSWAEDDRDMGQMLLAAHLMTLQGLGTGAEAEIAANGTGDFQTIRSGSLTLTRFDRGTTGASGTLDSTSFGRQFAALARMNVGGPRVMATGIPPFDPVRYPQGYD